MEKFHFVKLAKVHDDAIRGLFLFRNSFDHCQKLVTVSRDSEAKIFSIDPSTGLPDFAPEHIFFLPTQISSVVVLDKYPSGPVFIFGCLNGHIYVFHGYEQNASQFIENKHTNNVCVVKTNVEQTMVASGSWDHSAIIWKVDVSSGAPKLTAPRKVTGHSESVMDILFLTDEEILTASSDRSIVLWNIAAQPFQVKAFLGHDDCVRGILMDLTPMYFYSISNDQTVRKWNLETHNCESIYHGHEHFIFNITDLTSGFFVTCGENNTVCIWNRDMTVPVQKLHLPTVTIWAVLALDPQILVAAGSDGLLYIFSNRGDLQADPDSQSIFDEMLVKQTKIPFATVAHLDLFEENSLVSIPPKQEGERRLIRSLEDDTVLVYEWNKVWKPIGSVPDYQAKDSDQVTGRLLYNGQFYDEVLNIRLNNKNYKFPFNRDQDPWIVAASFIDDNYLDKDALELLVRAIVSNATYEPKNRSGDAFSYSYFPLYDFKLFDQMPDLEKFRKKFEEFNSNVEENLKLKPEYLQVTTSELKNPDENAPVFIEVLLKLFCWQCNKFIIYDILRILLSNRFFNTYFLHRLGTQFFHTKGVFGRLVKDVQGSEDMPLQLTSMRVLANLFTSVHGALFMFQNFDYLVEKLLPWNRLLPNLNIHLAYAAIWFNYSVLLTDWKKKQNEEFKHTIMLKILEHANSKTDFDGADKVALEVLNTFGNLLAAGYRREEAISFHEVIKTYPSLYPNLPEIGSRVRDISNFF